MKRLSFAAIGMLWYFGTIKNDRVTDLMLMNAAANNLTELMDITFELVCAGYLEKVGHHEWQIVKRNMPSGHMPSGQN